MDKRSIEKILSSFEAVNEWADVIKFLSMLSKTLSHSEHVSQIPCDILLSKRLAQCLNPALPVGVHTKAVEVYSQIFSIVGTRGLAQNLHLYSFGLFSLFGHASMTVKPQLLSVFEKYFIPLDRDLIPCFKGMIIACLSGLEDESNEYFGRIHALLDSMRSIDVRIFYEAFWLATITAPRHRFPAILYLAKRFQTPSGPEELQLIVGDVSLFLMAINSCLSDTNILAQRTCLDFILSNFKLDQQLLSSDELLLIMESVLAVTLRKDMSLSRRLYTWLMTDEDNPDKRFEYFSKHGLVPVKTCILTMCRNCSTDPAVLIRPYKILMALLDKQNLGLPVVEEMFYDMMVALKSQLTSDEVPDTIKNELIHTSTMFFSALDPFVLWSNMHYISRAQVDKETADTITFVLQKIRLVDEETLTHHLPLFILSLLEICVKCTHFVLVQIYIRCISFILDLIPSHFMAKASTVTSEDFDAMFMTKIALFYENGDESVKLGFEVVHAFPRAMFHFCTALIVETLKVNRQGADVSCIKNHLEIIYNLIYKYEDRLNSKKFFPRSEIKSIWVQLLVQYCIDFGQLSSLMFLIRSVERHYIDVSVLDSNILPQIVSKIWATFDSFNSYDHAVASSILWKLNDICSNGIIDDLITGFFSSESAETTLSRHFDRFGTFWRASEQVPEASIYLNKPLFFIIELLRCDVFWKRRLAETFVRCSLKSVSKLLDPLVVILLELTQPHVTKDIIIADTDIAVACYTSEFNSSMVNHVFELFIDLMQYGGHQLVSSLKNLKISSDSILKLLHVNQIKFENKSVSDTLYIDLILKLAVDFLSTEPSDNMSVIIKNDIVSIQMNSASFLQFLVTKSGDIDSRNIMEQIPDICLKKLLWCIEFERFDLQTKLISLYFASLRYFGKKTKIQNDTSGFFHNLYGTASNVNSGENLNENKVYEELLLKVLRQAISSVSNKNILPYYTDFILNSLAILKSSFRTLIVPLIECILSQVIRYTDVLQSREKDISVDSSLDVEITLLLNTLEKIYLFCYSEVAIAEESDLIKKKQLDAYSYGIKGISDFVTGVFVTDANTTSPIERKSREILVDLVVQISHALCTLWKIVEVKPVAGFLSDNERIRYRIRRLFDVLVQLFPNETVEALILHWMSVNPLLFNITATFDNLDDTVVVIMRSFKTFGPKECISSLLAILKDRMLCIVAKEKSRKSLTLNSIALTENLIIRFLEYYCGFCIDQKVFVESFQQIMSLFKEFISHASHFHQTHFSILMALTTIVKKLPSSYTEDKRLKKEILDIYIKFCELSILIAGRSFDSSSWRKREIGPNNSSDSAGFSSSSNSELTKSMQSLEHVFGESGIDEVVDDKKLAVLPLEITAYFSSTLIPSLRSIVDDHDRIVSILTNMIYYSINGNLKRRSASNNLFSSLLEQETLHLIVSVSHISFAFKVWRKDAWELFQDLKFFDTKLQCLIHWKTLLYTIGTNENDRIQDLTGKIITAPIGIFTSKEQEYYSRALSLRKIAFMIFSGMKDQYVSSVPGIQEKLVDMLKQPYSTAHAEVYFCLRVLFLKVSAKSLVSIWPIVITEMIKLLNMAIASKPGDITVDFLCVLLAACKFLDFLILSTNEDFQMFSWIFNANISTGSNNEEASYGSLIEKLHTISVGSIADRSVNSTPTFENSGPMEIKAEMAEKSTGKKKLFLDSKLNYKTINSLAQLNEFFRYAAAISINLIKTTCKNHYDAFPTPADSIIVGQVGKELSTTLNEKTVDIAEVERQIMNDFLESPQSV